MPPTSITVLARLSRSAGTYGFGPVSVPDDVTVLKAAIGRASLDALPADHEVIRLSTDLSLDGGQSWQFFYAVGTRGGITLDKLGQRVAESAFVIMLPPNPNKQLRGVLTLADPLNTEIRVSVM